ncbi:MAG: glycoside hydrolase family 44 protein [Oscillospiraceae bacterium]|jgi:hypothetical protein
MKSFRKTVGMFFIWLIAVSLICTPSVFGSSGSGRVSISVDMSAEGKPISPYIYGVTTQTDFSETTVKSIIQSGKRFSSYNWENNASNSGSLFYHTSDLFLTESYPEDIRTQPALVSTELSKLATVSGIPYTVVTLPMLDYAAKDFKGPVSESESAPSSRWVRVLITKPDAFSAEPDTNDGYAYTDEYVNYLVSVLGKSTSPTGIKAYSLDYQPEKWDDIFPLIRSTPLSAAELINRTCQLSQSVKSIDPSAEIIGPSLSGFDAYESFDFPENWAEEKSDYNWFVDYYLHEMKKAEDEAGIRLLDVFAIHYFSQAGADDGCNVVECTDYSNTACNAARMQSVRTLWDSSYIENSGIGKTKQQYLPLLITLQASVNTYYPGTKIALTEYNFGGGDHISGGIAQVDALGVFAGNGVYLANLSQVNDSNIFQRLALNLYTNYDNEGSGFGDTFIPSQSSDIEASTSYASIDSSDDEKTVKLILTNKTGKSLKASVSLDNTDISYSSAKAYGFSSKSESIKKLSRVYYISNNSFTYTLEPYSAVELIISPDQTAVTEQTTTVSTEEAQTSSSTEEATMTEPSPTTTTVTETSAATSTATHTEYTDSLTDSADDSGVSENPSEEKNTHNAAPFIILAVVAAAGSAAGYIYFKKYRKS